MLLWKWTPTTASTATGAAASDNATTYMKYFSIMFKNFM
jgi:hypothetical protein